MNTARTAMNISEKSSGLSFCIKDPVRASSHAVDPTATKTFLVETIALVIYPSRTAAFTDRICHHARLAQLGQIAQLRRTLLTEVSHLESYHTENKSIQIGHLRVFVLQF